MLTVALLMAGWAAPATAACVNTPAVVTPRDDGSLNLTAESARGVGSRIEYMPEWCAFGWFTADDQVEWRIAGVKPGRYKVSLTWSVSDAESGKPFLVEAGKHRLEGVVEKSGSWETFKTVLLGELQIDANVDLLVFKPATRFENGALLDLRSLVLEPI